ADDVAEDPRHDPGSGQREARLRQARAPRDLRLEPRRGTARLLGVADEPPALGERDRTHLLAPTLRLRVRPVFAAPLLGPSVMSMRGVPSGVLSMPRGGVTRPPTRSSTSSIESPRSWASGVSSMRWDSTGRSSAFTSSG